VKTKRFAFSRRFRQCTNVSGWIWISTSLAHHGKHVTQSNICEKNENCASWKKLSTRKVNLTCVSDCLVKNDKVRFSAPMTKNRHLGNKYNQRSEILNTPRSHWDLLPVPAESWCDNAQFQIGRLNSFRFDVEYRPQHLERSNLLGSYVLYTLNYRVLLPGPLTYPFERYRASKFGTSDSVVIFVPGYTYSHRMERNRDAIYMARRLQSSRCWCNSF